MGVELQHCAVYGYILASRINYDNGYEHLLDYADKDAEPGDFVVYQNGRDTTELPIAGIVHFLTDSTRWNGPQYIDQMRLERPDDAVVQAMNDTISEELPCEPSHDNPDHIVFTYSW